MMKRVLALILRETECNRRDKIKEIAASYRAILAARAAGGNL